MALQDRSDAGRRYQIVRRLAVGGMGEVLLARSPGDERLTPGLVVVKRTLQDHPNRRHQDTLLREEARIALRLRHANLVETFLLEELANGPLLVMEYLAGRSMAQILGAAKRNKAPLPACVAVEVLRQAACGLYFAHTLREGETPLGLVHRDVSPANLFVTFDGRCKVIDFGVAKADDSEIRTSTGILKGKIGYMSPEHARGEKLDPRADLWSLGVVLWEMLVADRLFAAQNPAMTLHAITTGDIPSPRTRRPDVPKSLDELCMCLLVRDAGLRVQSGAELVQLIDQLPRMPEEEGGITGFLSLRFPEEARAGREEARDAAGLRVGVPVPNGLIEGVTVPLKEAAEEVSGEVTTRILDGLVLAALTESTRPAPSFASAPRIAEPGDGAKPAPPSEPSLEVVAGQLIAEPADLPPDARTVTHQQGRHGLLGLEMSTVTDDPIDLPHTVPMGDAVALGLEAATLADDIPTVDGRLPSLATAGSARERREGGRETQAGVARQRPIPPSPVAVALTTFGVLAFAMGIAFWLLSAAREPAPTYYFYEDGARIVVVARKVDAPPAARLSELDPAHPPAFFGEKGESLRRILDESGLPARARMPRMARAKIAAALPAAISLLGLLSLSLALPSMLRLRGGRRAVAHAALLAISLAAALYVFLVGGLGWPGRAALGEEPGAPPAVEIKRSAS